MKQFLALTLLSLLATAVACGDGDSEPNIEATVQAAVQAALESTATEEPSKSNATSAPLNAPTQNSVSRESASPTSTPIAQQEALQESSPEEIVNSWVDAFNSGNVDDLTALYTNDVTLEISGEENLSGKAEVLESTLEFIADNAKVTLDIIESNGNALTGDILFASEEDPSDDISGIITIGFEGNRIVSMAIVSYDALLPSSSSEPAAQEPRVAELSFFEEEVVGLWSRYHSYDGSTQYIKFNADRTACKWEEPSGSNRRLKVSFYPSWDLDEDNPVRENRFSISIEKAGISYSFDYLSDQLWPSSFTNLKHSKSTSGKFCEE